MVTVELQSGDAVDLFIIDQIRRNKTKNKDKNVYILSHEVFTATLDNPLLTTLCALLAEVNETMWELGDEVEKTQDLNLMKELLRLNKIRRHIKDLITSNCDI